jgi:hypothetical protein
VHYRAILGATVGVACLEGQGTSAASSIATSRCRCRRSHIQDIHLAVQGVGDTSSIARGDLLALGTSTTRDNGHIAIPTLAVTA